jgi:hypothetical protein
MTFGINKRNKKMNNAEIDYVFSNKVNIKEKAALEYLIETENSDIHTRNLESLNGLISFPCFVNGHEAKNIKEVFKLVKMEFINKKEVTIF